MKRIILKIDEAMARKWNTLSLEPSTPYKASIRKEMKKREMSEQEKKTSLSEEEQELRIQKVRDAFSRFNSDLSNFKFNREEANESLPTEKSSSKEERRQRIESLTSPLLVDLSKFKFDRNEANDYDGE